MDIYLWGPLVRAVQAVIASFPTLFVGWLIAAVFESILGREGTFKLFGGRSWRQLPQAWLLGMLLPVCSLGVIPVMVQMRKSGIAGGTILAFGLTAPLFNPISVLYGLTLSDPIVIMVFCLCSLTIVTANGLLWDWFFPESWIEPEKIALAPGGFLRVGAFCLSLANQAWNRINLYILGGYVGVALLAMVLPAGVLQHAAAHDNLIAPLTMASVATFAYVTPMAAIVQVASMFEHGNSIGASFTLLVLGTGVNVGSVLWTLREYGAKKTFVWMLSLFAIVLALGYLVDRPLYPKGVDPADHTHAFDSYCNPFQPGTPEIAQVSFQMIKNSAGLSAAELIAGGFCIIFMLLGWGFRLFDPQGRVMRYLTSERAHAMAKENGFDRELPNSVIAAASLSGLVVLSIVGCFLYYPPASEIHKEMVLINTELQHSATLGNWKSIEHWIPIQEDWSHKLSVSSYLRRQPLTRFQTMKLKVFQTKLELLEHAAEDGDREESKQYGQQMTRSFRRLFASLNLPKD